MHVAQEIDIGEVEISSSWPRSATIFTKEVPEKRVQLVLLSDDDQFHIRSLSLLRDEIDNLADLPRRWIVTILKFGSVHVDLGGGLDSEDIADPSWTDSEPDEEKHEEAIFQDVDAVVGHFLDGTAKGMGNSNSIFVILDWEVVKWNQPRVEVSDGGGHVHGSEAVHEEGAIIAAEVSTAAKSVRLEEAVGVQR